MTAKKRAKGYKALIMAVTLIWSLPMDVSAGNISQNDTQDINKLTADMETDIYQVVMPTDIDGMFDFILDPQGLINETNGALHGGKSFEKDCTVFFQRSDGEVNEDYSRKSDSVTITNKSTMPVEVSLEVKVDPNSLKGIKMTGDSKFKKDKSASLYLAVVDGKKEVPVGKDGVTLHKTIEAAPDGTYEYVYINDTKKYEYRLKKNIDENIFGKYSFRLTGAANEKGDWAALSKAVPKVIITWKVFPKKNTALRKDAILNGKVPEIKPDVPAQKDEQQGSEEEPQPVKDTDNTETVQEEPVTVENEEGKSPPADDNGNEQEALKQDKADKEEQVDMDTEALTGE